MSFGRFYEEFEVGQVLTVLWENLTDPVLTGREELGFAKRCISKENVIAIGPEA